jgi:ABC-type dipeptide/oligopeptide/nickel transport system ATPase component
LEQGETLGIVGETEAGKSVLINSIIGLVRPPGRVIGGSVYYKGLDLTHMEEKQLRNLRGSEIALIPPNARQMLNPMLRIGPQIANVIRSHKSVSAAEATDQVIDLLSKVQIPDPQRRALSYPHELSGGMAQRVVIAIALSCAPKILLADEPTANLDVTVQAQVLDLIRNMASEYGTATLLVTRDLGIVAHYCGRVAVMRQGEIVDTDEVKSFFRHPQHQYSQHLLNAVWASRGDRSYVYKKGGYLSNRMNLTHGAVDEK